MVSNLINSILPKHHFPSIIMNKSSTVGFLFKPEGIKLQALDGSMQITDPFITRDIIDQINEKLKDRNFKVDEASVRPKYIDHELYLEGFAREIQEPKTVGFFSGKQE